MRTGALKFSTIAVATDLSETASSALRYAQAIAHQHGSALVIVHVIDPVSYAFPRGTPSVLAADQAARQELQRIEETSRRQGIAVHSVIESGIICERIVQTLVDNRVDLLVLGTRAKTEAGRVALGTVARQLLAKAPCSILTVSPNADPFMAEAGRWRRILVATDFSPASLAALSLAQSIVHDQLLVLHVAGLASEDERSHCLERLRFLAPFDRSHTVPVDHLVESGDTGEIIAKDVRKFGADLVVLGSPETELSAEDLPTSTVLKTISEVSCPVLCVPAQRGSTTKEIIEEVGFTC